MIAETLTGVRDGFGLVLDAQPDLTVVAKLSDSAGITEWAEGAACDVALIDLRLIDDDVPGMMRARNPVALAKRVVVRTLTHAGGER